MNQLVGDDGELLSPWGENPPPEQNEAEFGELLEAYSLLTGFETSDFTKGLLVTIIGASCGFVLIRGIDNHNIFNLLGAFVSLLILNLGVHWFTQKPIYALIEIFSSGIKIQEHSQGYFILWEQLKQIKIHTHFWDRNKYSYSIRFIGQGAWYVSIKITHKQEALAMLKAIEPIWQEYASDQKRKISE